MSKQPPPAPTASAVGPCPTLIQISRTPRHWKFTQHHRTTRPPPPIALAVGAGGGGLDIFTLIYPFSFLSPSLWEMARYRLKYCLKGPLSPKQPTNQSRAGPSYNLDYSRARAYCACSRCGWGLFGHFYSHLSVLSSFSLSLGDGPI